MAITFKPIGWVRTGTTQEATPHFYAVSDIEGILDILPEYEPALTDIQVGERITVIFHFDRSPAFTPDLLRQIPRKKNEVRGVFSICSPKRPNPIGMSVVEVLEVKGCRITVRGLDMFDGTPILDIKPYAPKAPEK